MSNNKSDFQLDCFSGKEISFDYPQGGQVIEFNHSKYSPSIRMIGLVYDERIEIDIEKIPDGKSAKEEIEKLSRQRDVFFDHDKIGPDEFLTGAFKGWRYVTRFIDGGIDRGYIDTVFLDSPKGVFKLAMNTSVERYQVAKTIMDVILNSLRVF